MGNLSTQSPRVTRLAKRKHAQISYDVDKAYQSLGLDDEDDDSSSKEARHSESQLDGSYSQTHGDHSKPTPRKKARAAKKRATEQKPFPFLRLPPELREMIYTEALVECRPMILSVSYQRFRRSVKRSAAFDPLKRLVPALLSVSKQVNTEAASLLYGQDFQISDSAGLHAFLAIIGSSNARLLRNLTLHSWGDGRGALKTCNFSSLSLLAPCTNLQTLFFDCGLFSSMGAVPFAQKIYREGFQFCESLARARGKLDACLDVFRVPNYGGRGHNSRAVAEFEAEMRRLMVKHSSGSAPPLPEPVEQSEDMEMPDR